MRAIFQDVMTL